MNQCKKLTSAETKRRLAEGKRISELLGPPKATVREVAAKLGISRQSVLRLEQLALAKLAKELRYRLVREDIAIPEPAELHEVGEQPAKAKVYFLAEELSNRHSPYST